jgi:DNA-binding NarL/FixJ family response regulator
LDKLRLIVAEDHETMRDLLVSILKDTFEIVYAAANGRELLDAALLLHPDVIVTDISMPILSGPGAMQVLRSRGHNIPFVFVSADSKLFGIYSTSFVSKTDAPFELVPAVRAAASGRIYVSLSSPLRNSEP